MPEQVPVSVTVDPVSTRVTAAPITEQATANLIKIAGESTSFMPFTSFGEHVELSRCFGEGPGAGSLAKPWGQRLLASRILSC